MTGAEFNRIRTKLFCEAEDFASALGYAGTTQTRRSVVYGFETGARQIPVSVAMLALMFDMHGIPDGAWFHDAETSRNFEPRSAVRRAFAMFERFGFPHKATTRRDARAAR